MGFLKDIFGRGGRVVRGQVNQGLDSVEDATFESTVKQTVRDMREELTKTVNASAMAMSNHNRLEAEYMKYARQSEEWFARANQALDAGNDDLAKKALAKKSESDQQIAAMSLDDVVSDSQSKLHVVRRRGAACSEQLRGMRSKLA